MRTEVLAAAAAAAAAEAAEAVTAAADAAADAAAAAANATISTSCAVVESAVAFDAGIASDDVDPTCGVPPINFIPLLSSTLDVLSDNPSQFKCNLLRGDKSTEKNMSGDFVWHCIYIRDTVSL